MSTTPPKDDRRRYSRVHFDAQARLVQAGQTFPTTLIDISLNGLLVNTPENYRLRTDAPCTAHITLDSTHEINMVVSLIHSSDAMLGFQCTSIDMDSIVHLRRIIELNLGDPQASDRALAELLQDY